MCSSILLEDLSGKVHTLDTWDDLSQIIDPEDTEHNPYNPCPNDGCGCLCSLDLFQLAEDYCAKVYTDHVNYFVGKAPPEGFEPYARPKPNWMLILDDIISSLNMSEDTADMLYRLWEHHSNFGRWNDSRGIQSGTEMLKIIREHIENVVK